MEDYSTVAKSSNMKVEPHKFEKYMQNFFQECIYTRPALPSTAVKTLKMRL